MRFLSSMADTTCGFALAVLTGDRSILGYGEMWSTFMPQATNHHTRTPYLVACAKFVACEAVGDANDAAMALRKLVDLSCLDRQALSAIELRGLAAVARILMSDEEVRSPDSAWLIKSFPARVEEFLLMTTGELQ
jgi:hypothetical protein